jgi:mannose-1-phosphate guanylyltransferase/mannose-6-phosphate isomerase
VRRIPDAAIAGATDRAVLGPQLLSQAVGEGTNMDDGVSYQAAVAQSQRRIYPVVLSGGAGTRLWPVSRQQYPKQLLPLVSERTMLQETVTRTAGLPDLAAPFVICHRDHRFLVAEQLQEIGVKPHRIVLEPVGRNTAAALTVAALMLNAVDPEAIILAQPSDHHIANVGAFRRSLDQAALAGSRGWLTTFGIAAARPETGYGYIRQANVAIEGADGVFAVRQFVEKPDLDTATQYVESGQYFWNGGIFLLPVSVFLEEVERLQPEILRGCAQAVSRGHDDLDFFCLDDESFSSILDISVDKAIMELTDRAAVVPVEMGWSDIGSWRSLYEVHPSDRDGNVLEGDVALDGVRNSYVRADGHFVAALGVENVVIVATDDVFLVAHADRSPDIGKFVERLRSRNRSEVLHHSKVYRPWGFYQTIDTGDRFQVKRIMVKPGAMLSLQMHHHRAEHWVVVSGTARLTCDGESRLLHENQSTYIPLGSSHRLENPGKLPLHLIEVQSGPYLGEDDIVRFEDTYGRH